MVQQIQNIHTILIKINNMKWIKLGDYAEALRHVITFGFGGRIASLIATQLGYSISELQKQYKGQITPSSIMHMTSGKMLRDRGLLPKK